MVIATGRSDASTGMVSISIASTMRKSVSIINTIGRPSSAIRRRREPCLYECLDDRRFG